MFLGKETSRTKCIATSNKCLTSNNKKPIETIDLIRQPSNHRVHLPAVMGSNLRAKGTEKPQSLHLILHVANTFLSDYTTSATSNGVAVHVATTAQICSTTSGDTFL